MAEYTFKILQCEHRTILKYVWSFFHIIKESVKNPLSGICTWYFKPTYANP